MNVFDKKINHVADNDTKMQHKNLWEIMNFVQTFLMRFITALHYN